MTSVGHTSLSGCDGKSYERSSANLMWHRKDDPQLFPDSARGALRTTRHGGSSIIGDAAGVGVMISRTPRITVRDREVGRDVVSREARNERGSRVLGPG